jgi:hypothetical protein
MKINIKNKKMLKMFEEEHIKDGGKMPVEASITNLIHYSCVNKKYKTSKENVKICDVLMFSNFANDVYFGVVAGDDDDDEGIVVLFCDKNRVLLSKNI